MKKLLLIFIFLFPILIYAENYITIETSKGSEKLLLPDNYEDLKEAYINMAKLYIEERYALDHSLKHINTLLAINEKNNKMIDELNTIINNIKNPFYRHGILLGIENELPLFQEYRIKSKLGYRLIFYNTFTIDLILSNPVINFEILLGFQF